MTGRRAYRTTGSLAALAILAGCGAPPQRSAPLREPWRQREALTAPTMRETQTCFADLRAIGVAFQPLPDREMAPGCALIGTVRLIDVGVPTTNLGAVRCGEARAYAGWARNAVAPAAYQILGSELAKVETFGSYACRNTIGTGGPPHRSGHAIANAIDIAGFVLKDGRRITVLGHWHSADPAIRLFWTTIHSSACKRFGTVLSPDYNAAHANHFHLEADRAGLCR